MDSQEPRPAFVKLAFQGARFENARLPADASVNLSIYQKILVELAKQIWREKNPNRLRLPRNFERYFQLELGPIEDGSAIAHLPRFEEDLPPLFGASAPGDIFDKAQDKLVEIIDAANDNSEIPHLSQSVRYELRNLRKSLRETEDILVTRGRQKRKTDSHRVSVETRSRITKIIRQEKSKNIVGFGILTGVSENPPEIVVTSEHGKTPISVNFETARLQFSGKQGHIVDFNILAIVDYDEKIKSVEAVNSFNLVPDGREMIQAVDRVEQLSGLEEGWLDGTGDEISALTILTTRDLARFVCSFEKGVGIFPTTDGQISLEYTRNDLEWTVQIRERRVVVEVMNLELDETITKRFKGASSGLMRMLLSENGIVDE